MYTAFNAHHVEHAFTLMRAMRFNLFISHRRNAFKLEKSDLKRISNDGNIVVN